MYHPGEHDRQRIARLKSLAAQLERLPQSGARDRLLREAHHRTVMVDTGVPPSVGGRDRPGNRPAAFFEDMAVSAVRPFR